MRTKRAADRNENGYRDLVRRESYRERTYVHLCGFGICLLMVFLGGCWKQRIVVIGDIEKIMAVRGGNAMMWKLLE